MTKSREQLGLVNNKKKRKNQARVFYNSFQHDIPLTHISLLGLGRPRSWLFDAVAALQNEYNDHANQDHADDQATDDQNQLQIDWNQR